MRLSAEKMQAVPAADRHRQQARAGGNQGSAEVARAAADGYTWLFGPDSLVTVNPHVYKQMPFKVEQLVPVTIGTQFNQTLVCNPALGVKTVAELIAKAKAEPLIYASGGPGVPGHLSMELLQSMAGFQMRHIPYKGPAPATQDVLGSEVPCGLLAGPRCCRMCAPASRRSPSGSRRSPTLPDATLAEAGVAGCEADFTLVVSRRLVPDAIVGRFRQAFVDAINAPDVVQLRAGDQTVVGSTPGDAAAVLAADSRKWGAVARRIRLGSTDAHRHPPPSTASTSSTPWSLGRAQRVRKPVGGDVVSRSMVTSMNGHGARASTLAEAGPRMRIVGSGIKARRSSRPEPDVGAAPDPGRQLIGAQCSGTLMLVARPARRRSRLHRPHDQAVGSGGGRRVLNQPFASGNVATAGGCFARSAWRMDHRPLRGRRRGARALHYVAPVGEKDDYVARAMRHIAPYLPAR
jgi:tripartite-type tricarboxylate transporter receptor subunit TctC